MSGMIINPGSGAIASEGDLWTNTYEQAWKHADEWVRTMRADGLADIEVSSDSVEREGRWTFTFRHKVTGVEVALETHGINDLKAYERERVFAPRVYWNGGSSSTPDLEDFAAPGFHMVKTYVADSGGSSAVSGEEAK